MLRADPRLSTHYSVVREKSVSQVARSKENVGAAALEYREVSGFLATPRGFASSLTPIYRRCEFFCESCSLMTPRGCSSIILVQNLQL